MMKSSQPRCYWCNKFITLEQALYNVTWIQNPNTADPDAYEICMCDSCASAHFKNFERGIP